MWALADGYDYEKEGCIIARLGKQKVTHCDLKQSLNNVACAWNLPCSSACLYPCMCHTHSLAWGPCVVPEMVNLLQSKLLRHSIDLQSLQVLV